METLDKNTLDLNDSSSSKVTEMYLPFWIRFFGALKMEHLTLKL
jgi:hypothetical protein